MTGDTFQQTGGILVIANRTCPCPTLVDEVARRANNTPTAVLVVAPALNSRLRHWVSDVDDAVARARERVRFAVDELRERGVSARGEVGDANPLLAITTHWPISGRRRSSSRPIRKATRTGSNAGWSRRPPHASISRSRISSRRTGWSRTPRWHERLQQLQRAGNAIWLDTRSRTMLAGAPKSLGVRPDDR